MQPALQVADSKDFVALQNETSYLKSQISELSTNLAEVQAAKSNDETLRDSLEYNGMPVPSRALERISSIILSHPTQELYLERVSRLRLRWQGT